MNKALLVIPLVLLSLLMAIWTGWIRIGWSIPVSDAAGHHGAIMVNSFLASLIFLERAVTFKNKWVLLLPFINACSIVPFLYGAPQYALYLIIAGSAGFLAMCIYFAWRYKALYYYVFIAGAACLLVGNTILLQTGLYPAAVTWWMGFLLFTIVAERLELSRFLKLTSIKRSLLLLSLVAVLVSLLLPFHLYGSKAFGISVAATAIWLLRYDMARHSVKAAGQHRFSGLLLLTGYAWLIVMALLLFVQNRFVFGYDAVLHGFFIGFVFSMIFSHAPIIIPGILKMPLKIYRPQLYLWFGLMQASLVMRIVADLMESARFRMIGGMANGIAILIFFINIVMLLREETGAKKKLAVKKV